MARSQSAPEPCSFVIFGATGDLALTKLLPALYRIERSGAMPAEIRFVASGRRDLGRDGWRARLTGSLKEVLGEDWSADIAQRLAQRFDYVAGDLEQVETFRRIGAALGGAPDCRRVVFYLALPPEVFPAVAARLGEAGLNEPRGASRIVVEKPFGRDLASARTLNALLHRHFDEQQVFRIDHFLGKEMVQNLMVFRFANPLIETVWNRHYVDHVQITVAESKGIEGRGSFYETTGALRDMVQNHLMQLLTLTAMEPPAALDTDGLQAEKVKVLRSLRPIGEDEVGRHALRAQYAAGEVNGTPVRGYRQEDEVAPASATETYAMLKLHIDNWRWCGVPFLLRTGKRLAQSNAHIALRLRGAPQRLFAGEAAPNWILIELQPAERLELEINVREPGSRAGLRGLQLEAGYRVAGTGDLGAYGELLLDVIEGDRRLFIGAEEIEGAWRLLDPVLRRWEQEPEGIASYPAGSWGPAEAARLAAPIQWLDRL